MNYQIGDLTNIKDDDPVVSTIQAAYDRAYQMCDESDELIVGVWELDENGDAELIAIAFQHEVFT